MRLLSLLLIPVIFTLAFFASFTPIQADCLITDAPTEIQPGATIEITIQGTAGAGGFYFPWLQDPVTLNFIDIGNPSGMADPTSGIVTISFTAPTTEGTYTIGVNETLSGVSTTCTDRATIRVDTDAPTVSDPNKPAEIGGIVTIIKNIIRLLAPVAIVAFLIMMLIGGFQFLLSGGDPKAAGAARSTPTFAIIGIILVVFSWLILLLIKYVTGVDVTNVVIPGIGP